MMRWKASSLRAMFVHSSVVQLTLSLPLIQICMFWGICICRLRTMGGHRARVGVMAWSSHLLSSGSRDRNILQRDIRAPEDFQSKLLGHRSEVQATCAALVWDATPHCMIVLPTCHAMVSHATQGK